MISGQEIEETLRYAAYKITVTAGIICWSLKGCTVIPAGKNSSLLAFYGEFLFFNSFCPVICVHACALAHNFSLSLSPVHN
jgi:hypothetical protein